MILEYMLESEGVLCLRGRDTVWIFKSCLVPWCLHLSDKYLLLMFLTAWIEDARKGYKYRAFRTFPYFVYMLMAFLAFYRKHMFYFIWQCLLSRACRLFVNLSFSGAFLFCSGSTLPSSVEMSWCPRRFSSSTSFLATERLRGQPWVCGQREAERAAVGVLFLNGSWGSSK